LRRIYVDIGYMFPQFGVADDNITLAERRRQRNVRMIQDVAGRRVRPGGACGRS